MTQAEYKQWLIDEILQRKTNNNNSREQLQKFSVRTLEKLFDYVD